MDPTSAPRLGSRGGPVELALRSEPDRWIELSTYPVMGSGVQPDDDGTILVMRDVTEARRREAIRETFVGVLSHELRTPVTTIYGGAKLLAREDSTLDDETRRERVRRHHRGDRAAPSPRRGRRGPEPLRRERRRHRGRAGPAPAHPARGHRLGAGPVAGRDVPGSRSSRGPADRRGRPDVRGTGLPQPALERGQVRRRRRDGRGPRVDGDVDEVTVRILDDGPGFPVEETDRLFERFYRSPGTAGTASGAGIGLFVCARLIAAMGGRIWARPRSEARGRIRVRAAGAARLNGSRDAFAFCLAGASPLVRPARWLRRPAG